MNLYPLPGTVSMYRGWSAESPSACRSLFTTVFSPCSKSTKVVPCHRCRCSSSRLNDLARLIDQNRKDLQRLALEADPIPELAQIAREMFEFKRTERNLGRWVRLAAHVK